ncbi:hypothetical protein LZ30DRAFT_787446 [Colletotrichum cereale]|nr:hypothetical protein LZ30DRAFT_787446 [Colletotrichum cereale]
MKVFVSVTLFAILVAAAPTPKTLSLLQATKREIGEVSTDYIFTDDPAAEAGVNQRKKRESGEVSTDYIFTDDPAENGNVGQ